MQINLDTQILDEYKSVTADAIKNTGFAQKGYHSILRYDTWKAQKCMLSATRTDAEHVKTETFNAREWLDVIDLKVYVDLIVARGATHVYITKNTNDEDDLTDINVDAIKQICVTRDEDEYYSAYKHYVFDMNSKNTTIWHNFKIQMERIQQEELNELDTFMKAKKIYESLKHKFE